MHPRRRWPIALLLAALAVYLPTAVPFVVGPLTECDHCVSTYLGLLPVVPGVIAAAAVHPADVLALALAGAATLALLAGCTACARRLRGRDLAAVFVVLMPLIGLESYTLAVLLRA